MIVEGMAVAYAGDDPFQDVGSLGKVVALSGSGAHVMWQSGPKINTVDLVDLNDIVEHRGSKQAAEARMAAQAFTDTAFADTLDMPAIPTLQVRATYDDDGEDGLLIALSETGRLAVLGEYAEEALSLVASRIRNDPEFSGVLAQLDPDEAASVISRVASVVLRDRISEED